MSTNIDIINTIRLVLNIEQLRAQNSAQNISLANVPNSQYYRMNKQQAINDLKNIGNNSVFESLISKPISSSNYFSSITDISLDSEVAELAAASGRYQALADSVSRQFGLLQLAIKGNK